MTADEQREPTPDQPEVDRLRHRLRAVAIVVILILIAVRVLVPPVLALFDRTFDDDGTIILTLGGMLLVLLGLEVPAIISGGRK